MSNLVKHGFFDFDDVFKNIFGSLFENNLPEFMKNRFSNMEMREIDKGVEISVELPGVDINDVDISVDNNILTIKGEKKSENVDKKDGKVIKTERYYGSFERTISLGSNVDVNSIDATYDKGVLKLIAPKIESKDSIKIKVK